MLDHKLIELNHALLELADNQDHQTLNNIKTNYKERFIKLEILRLTREIVLDEFAEAKLMVHTKWLSDSEKLWNNHRQILPYPTNPLYPNEDVIIERSKTILNFIDGDKNNE